MGLISRPRGYVLAEIHPEEGRILGSSSKFPHRYGGADVGHEPPEEGETTLTLDHSGADIVC